MTLPPSQAERTVGRLARDAVVPTVASLAASQHDLITRAQLRVLGVNDMTMYRRARAGIWQRVLPAVYAIHSGEVTLEQRRVAASLYAGEDCQLTGLSALAWYGFRYVPEHESVYVLVPHQAHRKSAGFVRVQRTNELDDQVRRADLYRVCSPARAVVDACRELRDPRAVRAIVAEAIQRGFCGLHALERQIRRAARSRTALVRAAFEEVAYGVRSAPEGDLRTNLHRSKILPKILWNTPLETLDGQRLPTPDGWIPDVAIALEVDSREYHYRPEDWARTLERHNVLTQYGVLVLHFTPAQIRDEPDKVLRIVEEAYLRRKAAGIAVPVLTGSPGTT
jgi:hypothetical protein